MSLGPFFAALYWLALLVIVFFTALTFAWIAVMVLPFVALAAVLRWLIDRPSFKNSGK